MNRLRRMSSFSENHALKSSVSEPILGRNSAMNYVEHLESMDTIKTNSGPPVMTKSTDIHFEGDGILGIEYENIDGKAVVVGIKPGTVSSEYMKLQEGMIVMGYNKIDCSKMNYRVLMIKLIEAWSKESEIMITFRREITSDEDSEIESCSSEEELPDRNEVIYQFLEENECSEYYDKFIELGAKTLEDLEYVEYSDLEEMNIPKIQRRKLFKMIKLKMKPSLRKSVSDVFPEVSSPKQVRIYVNPNLTASQRIEEIERIQRKNGVIN